MALRARQREGRANPRRTDPMSNVSSSAESRVAIILAAGLGERMGGSKALLLLDGVPLLKAHVERVLAAGCDRAVVVTRPEVAARLGELPKVTMVSAATASQAESLCKAVQKVGKRGAVRVLVTPVDAPPVSEATIRALFAALDAGAGIATPHRDGKGGHPLVCRMTFLAPYAKKDDPEPPPILRELLAAHEAERVRIEVDDPRVGLDLDTPEDVVALTGAPPTFA
jgi:CTP:molybdopterin cytidylyltransferase MocA